jgi:hypothetical protein
MAATISRPLGRHPIYFAQPAMQKHGTQALTLPPSKGMREPGTNISYHTTANGLVGARPS